MYMEKGNPLKIPYTGILAIFSQLILDGKQIDVFEDGLESRDFIHVKDVATAVMHGMFSLDKNQIFNIGSGKSTTVIQIVNILQNVLNSKG